MGIKAPYPPSPYPPKAPYDPKEIPKTQPGVFSLMAGLNVQASFSRISCF